MRTHGISGKFASSAVRGMRGSGIADSRQASDPVVEHQGNRPICLAPLIQEDRTEWSGAVHLLDAAELGRNR